MILWYDAIEDERLSQQQQDSSNSKANHSSNSTTTEERLFYLCNLAAECALALTQFKFHYGDGAASLSTTGNTTVSSTPAFIITAQGQALLNDLKVKVGIGGMIWQQSNIFQ